ncbi:hypothetical protein OAA72_04280 [Amylibacter sp.]|nr:hypothetical protein [Amylibacter sp.]
MARLEVRKPCLQEKRFNPMNVSLCLGFAGANTHDSVFDTLLESG